MNRLIALHQLDRKTVPAFVYTADDTPTEVINISENLHRGNTNPIDEAKAIHELIASTDDSFSNIALMLGRSEDWINGRMKLLSLPDDLQADLKAKRLSIAVCTQLAYVSDTNLRRQIATRAIDYQASAKVVKQWVDTIINSGLPNQIKVQEIGSTILEDKHPEITLQCINCHASLPPFNFTSELVCVDCKVKMSGESVTGQPSGIPKTDTP